MIKVFYGYICASVIEIDEEGNVKVNNSEVSLSDTQKDTAKYLAWLSYQLQNNSSCLYFQDIGTGRGGIYYGGNSFRNALNEIAGVLGISQKVDTNAANGVTLSYNDYLNCDTAYVAKLFYFQFDQNGSGQEQVVAFAKEGKKPKIIKAITNIKTETEIGLSGAISDRKNMSESSKLSSPVSVVSNTTITYVIIVEGPATAKYEIKDAWDSGLTYISSSNGGTNSGNTVIWKDISGGTELELKLKINVSSGKYQNKAEIVGKNLSSSDYVECLAEKCTIDKYIIGISGSSPAPSIGNREGLSDSTKMSSAPKVSGTSISVTYKIVIKNTGVATVSGTYSDFWSSGMSYVSGSTSEIITLAPGEEKTYTVVLSLSTTILTQYYTNTAQFTYGTTIVKSSDYVQGYTEIKANGVIKKYVSSANGKGYGITRKNMTTETKNADPVEVVKRFYCNF
jgi:uncharacterized repeat protein (TIGR01451 family)